MITMYGPILLGVKVDMFQRHLYELLDSNAMSYTYNKGSLVPASASSTHIIIVPLPSSLPVMIVNGRIQIHARVCAYLAEILYNSFEWAGVLVEEHLFQT